MATSTALEDAEGIVRIRALRKGLDVGAEEIPGGRRVTVLEEGHAVLVVRLSETLGGFRAEIDAGGAETPVVEASGMAGRSRFTEAVAGAMYARSLKREPPRADPFAVAGLGIVLQAAVDEDPASAGRAIAEAAGRALEPVDLALLEAALRDRRRGA